MAFYIIPSPIGNLDDITIRSINVIKEIDFLVVENKTTTLKLLKRLDIQSKKIFTYNDHSNKADRKNILMTIKEGLKGGIISDAGTPLISDPGYKLIQYLIAEDINIISLPGPTAAITALTGSGLPTDKFQFYGFLPKKDKELISVLNECSNFYGTSIFYETPHRLVSSLEIIEKNYSSQVHLCVAKELTKLHESFFRGTPKDVLEIFNEKKELIKGEFVLLIYFEKKGYDYSNADKMYKKLESEVSIKEISKLASDITGINKNLLYKRFLTFSQKS
jgi:16S rRNA (cytidine1402-2'-O)-methyltransferase